MNTNFQTNPNNVNSINNPTSEFVRISFATLEGTFFFKPQEIVRLEARSNYTYVFFTNRKPLLVSRVLGEYDEILSGAGFVRTHRSHLVNRQHILYIDSSGSITMLDSSKAEISRRKKREVMQTLRNTYYSQSTAA
ncbi:MAG: LytTR family transcriptional regulator [Chitinophagaceae bacterium]|nr:LytTR family transcriptional regulator [Chitinophagaceae bacterium]